MIRAISHRTRLAQNRAHHRPFHYYRKTVGERLLGQLMLRKYRAGQGQQRGQRIWVSRCQDPCWAMKLGTSRAPMTLFEGGSLFNDRRGPRQPRYDIGRARIDCEVPF